MEPNIWKLGQELAQKSVPFCLCTIIESVGSVPRRTGSSLIATIDGSTTGTLGGGIVERLAVQEALLALTEGKSRTRSYDLDDPAGADTGAVCGGHVTIFFDVQRAARVVHLFGAGHVALPTARLLATVGYAVKVYDDSPQHANRERFPEAAGFVIGDAARIAADADMRPDDSVVILTASHDTDFAIVRNLKDRPLAYLGVIGSKAKAHFYREQLKSEGWTESDIERIHCPIGVSIGARTPEEIAVSIVAEMIALRGQSE